MAELKTKATKVSAVATLKAIPEAGKRADSLALLKIFQTATGQKPVMWGAAIVGFGKYHYKSERSTQEGDWPLSALSPRKQALVVYGMNMLNANPALGKNLGKYKMSGGCLHIKKLADVDAKVLSGLIKKSYLDATKCLA